MFWGDKHERLANFTCGYGRLFFVFFYWVSERSWAIMVDWDKNAPYRITRDTSDIITIKMANRDVTQLEYNGLLYRLSLNGTLWVFADGEWWIAYE